jgi:hypothetical protein
MTRPNQKERAAQLLRAIERLPALPCGASSANVRLFVEVAELHERATQTSANVLRAVTCPRPHPHFGDDGYRDHMIEEADRAISSLEAAIDQYRLRHA